MQPRFQVAVLDCVDPVVIQGVAEKRIRQLPQVGLQYARHYVNIAKLQCKAQVGQIGV